MPKIRNNRNICLYCFGDLDERRVCRACGKKANDEPNLPHQLAKRSMLQKRYLIDKAIGEGGFGITYAAWDVVRGIKVAIKEYYPSGYVSRDPRSNRIIINAKQNYAASNRGLKRFIDEAKNLTSINNLAGIVSVYDFFSANNTAYIVMEYLDGISLKKYVRRKGKLDIDATLAILKPVILSLGEVHATGLIHRDISPDNILITKNNEVKLIDFGASKAANPDGQSVSIVLKQGFAPEEQYRLHGEQGPWTDIYALGVTIYYCITGQLPPESIQRMYDDTIIPPSQLNVKIQPFREKALMKALAVFAKDRYQNIKDFAADLYKGDDGGDFPDLKTVLSKSSYVRPSERKTEAAAADENATKARAYRTNGSHISREIRDFDEDAVTDDTVTDNTVTNNTVTDDTVTESDFSEFASKDDATFDSHVKSGINPSRGSTVDRQSDSSSRETLEVTAALTADETGAYSGNAKTVNADDIVSFYNEEKTVRPTTVFALRDTAAAHKITPDKLKKKFLKDMGAEEKTEAAVPPETEETALGKELFRQSDYVKAVKEREFNPRTVITDRKHRDSAARLKKLFEKNA